VVSAADPLRSLISVGIVRSRTKGHGVSICVCVCVCVRLVYPNYRISLLIYSDVKYHKNKKLINTDSDAKLF
jgi:hypothetical protein